MKIPHAGAVCLAALLGTTAWAMNQGPASPPDATAAGAPSNLGHTNEPSGMAAGTGVNHDTVARSTQAFIQQTAQEDVTEEAAAQYALSNSRSPDIQAFARHALSNRSKDNDQLRDLAATLGVTMPTYPNSAQLRALSGLQAHRGAAFDTAYARLMADEHTQALTHFKRAAQSSRIDPAVRRFAQNSLPAMQDNLQQANRLLASHATTKRSAG